MTASDPNATEDRVAPRHSASATCAVCPHPWAAHDALGARFCSATVASALARGCICRT
ncbi:RGCVC family protein [Actinomycetospora lutea]|uniref:RGCVC family protein n=1 Tax=Actinomycetospora lutea TaxID=663604 RepID=UPI002365BC50|nr:RGCVC family protein [Actinomycetospora lutea]MDD7942673.1 RGCVC family protein [Actinomycetospora lutea]